MTAQQAWWAIIIGVGVIVSALYVAAGWITDVLADSYEGER